MPAVGAALDEALGATTGTAERRAAAVRVLGVANGEARAAIAAEVAARPREAKECDTCSARDACRLTPGEQRRRARNGRPLPLGQA